MTATKLRVNNLCRFVIDASLRMTDNDYYGLGRSVSMDQEDRAKKCGEWSDATEMAAAAFEAGCLTSQIYGRILSSRICEGDVGAFIRRFEEDSAKIPHVGSVVIEIAGDRLNGIDDSVCVTLRPEELILRLTVRHGEYIIESVACYDEDMGEPKMRIASISRPRS